VITYNATISAYEKGGQWGKALELLEEVQAQGIKPDGITYNATISAYEKGGQWGRALELLEEVQANEGRRRRAARM
jgi:pentatricopeptide repeat domain-containing protein 1